MFNSTGREGLDEIKHTLIANAEPLCLYLFGNPTRRTAQELRWGRSGSTKLDLRRGTFYSFETTRGGSMLDAIMFRLGLSFPEACNWARQWPGDDQSPRPTQQHNHPPAPIDADEEETLRTAMAVGMYHTSKPVAGTPGQQYLNMRGIKPEAWPDVVRFISKADILDNSPPRWARWWLWDALLLVVTDACGAIVGAQLVALNPDGSPVPHWDNTKRKLKISRGPIGKGAVHFTGPSDKPLLLAEGAETGLSVWWPTGFETWANLGSVSKANLKSISNSRTIIVCADDDPRNAPGNKSLYDAIRRWRREGRKVLVVKPRQLARGDKSDFNDLLIADGPNAVIARIENALRMPILLRLPSVDEARHMLPKIFETALMRLVGDAHE